MRDSRGLIYSTTLHGLMLFFLLVGLPDFFKREVIAEPEAVTVEVLPMAPVSNVKPQEKPPEVDKTKPIADKNTERKAAPETKKAEVKPAKQETVKLPDKKVPKKKEEKKKPDKKTEEDPLKAVLNDVKAHAKVEEDKKPTRTKPTPNTKEAKSNHYDPGAPLAMSDRDAIRQQITDKWSPPAGAKDAANLQVTLNIELNPDGSLIKAELSKDQSRYNSDPFFRAAVDSAIRAVHMASPLKNLPAEKYNVRDGWREIELTFDPKDAL